MGALDGKVAVVTGASRGLGEAMAVGFARAGASVVLGARTVEDLERVAQRCRDVGGTSVEVVPTDVGREDDVRALVDAAVNRCGGLDVFVANAATSYGMLTDKRYTDLPSYDLDIVIEGIASHAGVHPEAGVNALTVASLAVADLQAGGWLGLIEKGRHRGTSNIGIVQGGDATNVVMPRIELHGEVRSHDPKFRQRLADEFRKAFERAVKSVRNDAGKRARLTFVQDLKYESFALDPQSPCVQAAIAAAALFGLKGETRISNGGLDANWLSARGLPTVTLGSGQEHVHTTDETLYLDDYLNACRIAVALATGRV